MATLKQINFDTKKWLDSERAGRDMCGEYDYCAVCDKSAEYPCEKAYVKYTKMSKKRRESIKAKSKSTLSIDGKEVQFRSTIVEK